MSYQQAPPTYQQVMNSPKRRARRQSPELCTGTRVPLLQTSIPTTTYEGSSASDYVLGFAPSPSERRGRAHARARKAGTLEPASSFQANYDMGKDHVLPNATRYRIVDLAASSRDDARAEAYERKPNGARGGTVMEWRFAPPGAIPDELREFVTERSRVAWSERIAPPAT